MVKNSKGTVLIVLLLVVNQVLFGQKRKTVIIIDLSRSYQIMDNFGASDAWSCQFVGMWPDTKKDQIADLLFSKDTLKDGSPKGISLSLWRFNIGAGSSQQGDNSTIADEWHRSESFLDPDGSYNWKRQAGQLWFLTAAKKRGVKQFLGFTNSPPVHLTSNGLAHASNGKTNISADRYGAFGNYLSTVVKGIYRVSGVYLDYVSPVNEPQWDWSDNKQEGSPYDNSEISGLVRSINRSFIQNGVRSKILLAESGSISYLKPGNDKRGKNDQIADFFNPGSPDFVGGLKQVSPVIGAHSYFTTSPITRAIKIRESLAAKISTYSGLKYWQTEYCILGNNNGEIEGNKRDLKMDAALYLARVINIDVTAGNAAAWQWWTAISPYDYKDGLIYIDKNKTDGNYYASKMLWALGNYSRFVRPGATRVDAKMEEQVVSTGPLMVSAYKENRNLTVIIINPGNSDVSVALKTVNGVLGKLRSYTTSDTDNLKARYVADPGNITLTARSIITFISCYN